MASSSGGDGRREPADGAEVRRLEAALEAADGKFRALFEKGPIGVAYHRMVYDVAGRPVDYQFLEANQAYLDLTGVDPRGRLVTEAFPGIEKDTFDWIGTFGRVAKSGETIRFETYLALNQRWYDCVGYQYLPDHFVAAFIEITERKRLEQKALETAQQLAQSRKMDAIGQLAGGVAHDFNNMLTGILGAADLLCSAEGLSPADRELVQTITSAGQRAAELTSKLLAFGRKTNLQLKPVDVHAVIDEAASLLARTIDKGCRIVREPSARAHVVSADAALLQNVFINLGVNAAHAMPDGGTLTVSTRDVVLDEPYCQASRFALRPGPYVDIEVRDTGYGIAPEHLNRIFEPFFTTKAAGQGTGLGLSAVYGAIQDLRGAISVYSEPGRGTVFHIELPVIDGAVLLAGVEDRDEVVAGTGLVLVIDDEEVVRVTAQAMLQRLGYQVVTASDGLAGVQALERHRGEVVAVLLDMIMPVLSGRETFRRLRALDPAVGIVVCSGFSKDEELRQLQESGLSGFVRKPYRMAELSRAIDAARGRAGA